MTCGNLYIHLPPFLLFSSESFLEFLDYHAVRPLDLTVGSWVCNGDVFDFDARIFTELPELVKCEI
jgi:hypothetical protein